MTDINDVTIEDRMTPEQWYAMCKEAGLKIDPETAEVDWWFAYTLDPYDIEPNLPEEYRQVGRAYFARSPERDIWVNFCDLPKATREALWKKHKRRRVGAPLNLGPGQASAAYLNMRAPSCARACDGPRPQANSVGR